jgi:hypothetical protein
VAQGFLNTFMMANVSLQVKQNLKKFPPVGIDPVYERSCSSGLGAWLQHSTFCQGLVSD